MKAIADYAPLKQETCGDKRGLSRYFDGLAAHSALGSALTFQGVQMKRATIYQLEEDLRRIDIPALALTGVEDEPCVDPAVFMSKRPFAATQGDKVGGPPSHRRPPRTDEQVLTFCRCCNYNCVVW